MHQDHDKIQQAARDADNADSNGRREPRFATFDEDEDFEEPERDTDYATHYSDDEDLDEDFRLQEDVEEYLEDPDEDDLPHRQSDRGPDIETPAYAGRESAYSTERDFPDEEEDEWQEEPVHAELDDAPTQQWPLGLFIVGAVAILLLFAGGYGVIKQRAAMEEEIRQLQASLATAVGPEEIALSRTEIIELENRNSDLQARLDSLTLENSRLTDTVKDLQSQLQVRQDAVVKKAEAKPATPAPPPVKSEPVRPPAPKPAAQRQRPGPPPPQAGSSISAPTLNWIPPRAGPRGSNPLLGAWRWSPDRKMARRFTGCAWWSWIIATRPRVSLASWNRNISCPGSGWASSRGHRITLQSWQGLALLLMFLSRQMRGLWL